ncbi:MAG TPA: AraC family transcriptional regulator [Clostridiaceae bacterium]|nr:AraC family transcriptional regulator [Clostridiaceae bacterium]
MNDMSIGINEVIYNELLNLNINLHARISNPKSGSFHLHDTYEVYFFISGDVTYFIEKNTYPLNYGDLVITNTTEIHAPVFHSNTVYERIIFHFSPEFIRSLKIPDYDLEKCFIDRPNGKFNKVSLNQQQIDEFMRIYREIVLLNMDLHGQNILLKYIKLIELLVFINNAFLSFEKMPNLNIQNSVNIPDRIIQIINFIDANLGRNISLDILEKTFFINRTYLCTLFKKHIGKTVYQYILYKRISYAKQLLANGHNVTETCLMCGFNDYSNFIKTFKKITGKSPGKYRNSKQSR